MILDFPSGGEAPETVSEEEEPGVEKIGVGGEGQPELPFEGLERPETGAPSEPTAASRIPLGDTARPAPGQGQREPKGRTRGGPAATGVWDTALQVLEEDLETGPDNP